MFHANNIQGVGTCTWDMVQSLTGDPRLVLYQERYVAEIVRRLNDLDNVLFHICDEPWMGRVSPDTVGPWLDRMIDAFEKTEADLPKRHLLGQTIDWQMSGNAADFSADKRVRYIDVEYARGSDDLLREYAHRKPVVYIESVFYPDGYAGNAIGDSRVEAWEFMLGGCSGFMQLNALYTTNRPDAGGTAIDDILDVYTALITFLRSFDLYSMSRDTNFVVDGEPAGAFAAAISDAGNHYAFYIHHSSYQDPPPHPGAPGSYRHSYVVNPGSYRETFSFRFPAGRYTAEWVEPCAATVIGEESFAHEGGIRTLTAPEYAIDIALRVRLVEE